MAHLYGWHNMTKWPLLLIAIFAVSLHTEQALADLTIDDLIVATRQQESLLRNFNAKLTATITDIDPRFLKAIGETEQQLSAFSTEYVWGDGQRWRSQIVLYDTQNQPVREIWQSVDGQRHMSYIPHRENIPGNTRNIGFVDSEVSMNIGDTVPDRFMLVNVEGESASSRLNHDRAELAGMEDVNGVKAIAVNLQGGNGFRCKMFLDPDKGFAVVRMNIYRKNGGLAWVYDNIVLKEVDGVWFPMSGDCTVYMQDDDGTDYKAQVTRMQVDADSLQINQTLHDDTFKFVYPTGTVVKDMNLGIQYVVGMDKILDRTVQNITASGFHASNAPDRVVGSNGIPKAGADSKRLHDTSIPHGPMVLASAHLHWWIAGGAFLIIAALAVIVIYRHRCRTDRSRTNTNTED